MGKFYARLGGDDNHKKAFCKLGHIYIEGNSVKIGGD
jgi:hypothetical protein